MALSKRKRFEVFKRDAFTCQYCGRTPPVVVLHADHFVAVSNGGKDELANMVTSCAECNLGKSNVPMDCVPSPLLEKITEAQERHDQLKAYKRLLKSIADERKESLKQVADHYSALCPEFQLTDRFLNTSVNRFLGHFTSYELCEFMNMAVAKFGDCPVGIKYFCGICWKRIKDKGDSNA